MKDAQNITGFLILDKPSGISSNHALQRVKKIFQAKKAGHTGSLDVLATGLLPICFGEATKFAQYLLNADKYYRTVMRLGVTTTTSDAEGEVVAEKSTSQISDELINSVMSQFRGESQQIPSMYSALKHRGKPLYELARNGIEIHRDSRTIIIHELTLLDRKKDLLTLEVRSSKGTYIRTLVDDIGQVLGCGAYVHSLRRLGAGPFVESQMVTLKTLKESDNPQQYILPIDAALQHLPVIRLDDDQVKKLFYGQKVMLEISSRELTRIEDEKKHFLGLGKTDEEGVFRSVRLLAYKG